MPKAIIALGSNLGDRLRMIETAVSEIEARIGPCLSRSDLIETEAWIHPDDDADWHPPFLNGVAVFETTLEAIAVLTGLLAIEEQLGRERGPGAKPWQPRPIDLDLVALDDQVVDQPDLILPHPRMQERRFVLEPLAEVLPDWRHPVLGKTVVEMLATLPD
jgi:2-amino-4-hydroxy-6-hydroxymethyldihydropteridine diphosphokinase